MRGLLVALLAVALGCAAAPVLAQQSPGPTPITGIGAFTLTCTGSILCTPNPANSAVIINGPGLGSNTYTGGKQSFAVATASYSSIQIPCGASTPTSPSTGDAWCITGSGLFFQASTGVVGPIGGGGVNTCPTTGALNAFQQGNGTAGCKDYAGGSLIAVANGGTGLNGATQGNFYYASATNTMASGQMFGEWPISWPSTTTVVAATIPVEAFFPYALGGVTTGTINSVVAYTNGGTPSFTYTVRIGGVNVTGCTTITVNSSTPASTSCTGANALSNGSLVDVVIASVSGTPNQAEVEINYTHFAQ